MKYINKDELYMDGTENEDFIFKLAEEMIGKEIYVGVEPFLSPIANQVVYFEESKRYGITEVHGIHHIPRDEDYYTGVIYFKNEDGNEVCQTVDKLRDKSKLWVAQNEKI